MGTFEFRYPDQMVLCEPQYEGSNLTRSWPDSCESYLSICPGIELPLTATGPLHPKPVACIAYPHVAYKGTNFDGAAFSVSIIPELTTKSDCLVDRLEAQNTHWGTLGGEQAKISENGEGGLNHGLGSDVYQVFRRGQCYDIEVRITQTSAGAFDPGTIRVMPNAEEERIRRKVLNILRSFRFLN